MFLQVYKYFFCNKANTRSLLWVEFDICNGKESSDVLNKWYSLNHLKVLEKNCFGCGQLYKGEKG